MAPHLIWLVQNDFLPFAYAEARAAPPRGPLDHLLQSAPIFGRTSFLSHSHTADRGAAVLAASGAGMRRARPPTLSIGASSPCWRSARRSRCRVLARHRPRHQSRCGAFRCGCSSGFGSYCSRRPRSIGCGFAGSARSGPPCSRSLPPPLSPTIRCCRAFDHRYRAAFFPGDLSLRRDHATVRGKRPAISPLTSSARCGTAAMSRIIPVSRPQPRVLIDGLPRRAPWIDLADLRARGAVLVWTDGDPRALPENFAAVAPGAEIGAPFDLPFHRGDGTRACRLGCAAPASAVIRGTMRRRSARSTSAGAVLPSGTDRTRAKCQKCNELSEA